MGDLLDLVAAGRRNVQALTDPELLREVAGRIGGYAATRGIARVVAASPAAEGVVGAALMWQSTVSEVSTPVSPHTVLLVDVNFASGTVMAQAVLRARAAGATCVQGVVLHRLDEAVSAQDCGLDSLDVIKALSLPALTPCEVTR